MFNSIEFYYNTTTKAYKSFESVNLFDFQDIGLGD